MPFVSESQRKYCWVKYNQDIRDGKKTPLWDCQKWEKESPRSFKKSKSKRRKRTSRLTTMSKKARKSMRRKVSKTRKIHTGVRGGKYVLVKGKKIYV